MSKLLTEIKENWILILFVGSLIVGWTTFNNRLTVVESETQENTETLSQIATMKEDIAVIKINVEYLKDNIRNN